MSATFPSTASRRAAFTLIELLTVIAIIGILAALVIPTVGAVRTQARQAECISNLRQIGVAITAFADAHRGAFPETSHGAAANLEQISWVYTLKPFLGEVDEVRVCPLDPRREDRLRLRLSSYVLNDYLDAKTYYDPFGRPSGTVPRLPALREPARTPTVFVGADTLALDLSSDHIRAGAPLADRSDGRAPYLFADGHVQVISAAALKNRIAGGENFALPR
jgi:general secretion pathway protein G